SQCLMPPKKQQHFVPKFYLRQFSTDARRRRINLFNFESLRPILQCGIKNQSAKDYFHGREPGLEDTFGDLENESARIISKIILSDIAPKLHSEEHVILIVFALTLHARTLWSAEAVDEMFDKLSKATLMHDSRVAEHLPLVNFSVKNPVSLAVSVVAVYLPLMLDLEYRLVLNQSTIPFVSSDNPVVLYNQFLEHRKPLGSITGLALKGLQMFVPLSSRHLLVFYDPAVYRVGGWRPQPICTRNVVTVNSVNLLQALSARSNVYFSSCDDAEYVDQLCQGADAKRRQSKVQVNEYTKPGSTKEKGSSILHTFNTDIKCDLRLSFVHEFPDVKDFSFTRHDQLYRDKISVELLDEFQDRVRKGKYKASEYFKFLDDFGNAKE
ncbi:MAG: hypothetical protein A3D92_05825, partial [Bacteroidetes bacterium RIFCSPHIGHO2_02_FULL_44_7]